MNYTEEAKKERNQKKEEARKKPFEIETLSFNPYIKDIKNQDVVSEICKILIQKGLSYLEINEVLYYADKALHYGVLSGKI